MPSPRDHDVTSQVATLATVARSKNISCVNMENGHKENVEIV